MRACVRACMCQMERERGAQERGKMREKNIYRKNYWATGMMFILISKCVSKCS